MKDDLSLSDGEYAEQKSDHFWTTRRRWDAYFVSAVFVVAVCGAVMFYRGISTSLQAEANLHYSLDALQIVERFVTQNGRWPRSWAELEGVDMREAQFARDWPRVSADMQQWVVIDFGADPKIVAQQDRMNFSAIKPKGPYYEYRDYGYVEKLQDAIRKSISGGKPKSSGNPPK
jgi:hypothetical protein